MGLYFLIVPRAHISQKVAQVAKCVYRSIQVQHDTQLKYNLLVHTTDFKALNIQDLYGVPLRTRTYLPP